MPYVIKELLSQNDSEITPHLYDQNLNSWNTKAVGLGQLRRSHSLLWLEWKMVALQEQFETFYKIKHVYHVSSSHDLIV